MDYKLPSTLYAGGAVVAPNPNTEVNLYAQLLQRRQAKRDALDQYYQKILTDVTPTGMRNKDVVGGWSQKLSDWQSFAMNPQNRKYLLNPKLDGYKTLTEFNQRHQDLLNDVARSKNELKEEALINQHRLSGKWNPTDEDMILLNRKGMSIYDANRLDEKGDEPDMMGLSFNVPEFTPLQETQLYKSASQNIPKSKIPDLEKRRYDRATASIFTPYTKKYSPEQINLIAESFANNLTKSALNKYEDLMHDSNAYNAANAAYGKVYRDDIIDTPQKMAKGVAIMRAMNDVETGEDKGVDQDLQFERKKQLAAINNGYRMGQMEFGHALSRADKETANLWIDEFVNGLPAKGIDFKYKEAGGSERIEKKIPLSPVLEKALTIDGKVTADFLFQTPDGNFRYGLYQRYPKGVKDHKEGELIKEGDNYAVDKDRTKIISPEDLKMAIGKQAGVSQMNKEMGGVHTTTTTTEKYIIKGKAYTKKQLNDMGYTDDQIAPYIKK